MLVPNGDGTYMGGPLDMLCILHNERTGRYHAAFFEEKPMPGPVASVEDTKVVRLKSKMHHTTGAPDIDGANKHLDDLVSKIKLPDGNVERSPIEWDGEIGITILRENWVEKSGR